MVLVTLGRAPRVPDDPVLLAVLGAIEDGRDTAGHGAVPVICVAVDHAGLVVPERD